MAVEKKTVNLILNLFLIAIVALAAFSIMRSLTEKLNISTAGITGLVVGGEKSVKVVIQFSTEISNNDIDFIEGIGKIEKIDYADRIIIASVPPSQVNDIQLQGNVRQVTVQQ